MPEKTSAAPYLNMCCSAVKTKNNPKYIPSKCTSQNESPGGGPRAVTEISDTGKNRCQTPVGIQRTHCQKSLYHFQKSLYQLQPLSEIPTMLRGCPVRFPVWPSILCQNPVVAPPWGFTLTGALELFDVVCGRLR